MKRISILAAIAAGFVAPAVMAYPGSPDSGLTLYGGAAYMTIDDGGGNSVKPKGYDLGARLTMVSTMGLQGAIDYTHFSGTKSGVDADQDEIRGTIGYGFPVGANAKIYAEGGYESARLKLSDSGTTDSETFKGPYFGLGGNAQIAPAINAYGRLGYLSVKPDGGDSASGPDVLAGLGFQLNSAVSLIVEYRYLDLSDNGASIKYQNVNAGVKFSFQ